MASRGQQHSRAEGGMASQLPYTPHPQLSEDSSDNWLRLPCFQADRIRRTWPRLWRVLQGQARVLTPGRAGLG